MHIPALLLSFFFHFHASAQPADTMIVVERSVDLKSYYDEYKLDGFFSLYNEKDGEIYTYNNSLFKQSATPASTFNIVTALVALQEEICKGNKSIIKWNGTVSRNPQANKDITLEYAFQNNIDWVFWELRKTISNKMNYWLKKMNYGNRVLPVQLDSMKTNGNGTDMFWVVSPAIRTTPGQQLGFMQDLYYNKLPFSKKNMETVRNMMYQKDINDYKIYGKRGSYKLNNEKKYIGWFVGYAVKNGKPFFFVNYLQSTDLNHPSIVYAQKDIVYRILEKEAMLK